MKPFLKYSRSYYKSDRSGPAYSLKLLSEKFNLEGFNHQKIRQKFYFFINSCLSFKIQQLSKTNTESFSTKSKSSMEHSQHHLPTHALSEKFNFLINQNSLGNRSKQAGAELCQAKHSLS